MAAPSFVAASTGATDAGGAWTATCHAPGAAGRIIVFQVLQDGTTNNALTFATGVTNIEDLAGTDNAWTQISGPLTNGGWAVGASEEALQYLFIGRSLSTSAPTIGGGNSTSEDLYWRFYEFSDVSTGTTLATVIENSTAGNATNGVGTSNTASDTSVTTLGPDRLALNFVAVNDDNAISAFTGETGGNWTLAVAPYADSGGTDGAIGLQIAIPAAISQFTSNTSVVLTGTVGSATEKLAQSFTTIGAVTLSKVVSTWKTTGSPTGDLILELQTDSSGAPSGTVLSSGTFACAGIPTAGIILEFASSASLSAATKYWIVGRRTVANDSNRPEWLTSTTADLYSGGGLFRLSSGSWTSAGANYDGVFAVVSTADQAGITIDGGTEDHVDSDAWGVVGFALIGTTPSGPDTHYGATVSAFTAAVVSLGRLTARAVSTLPLTASFVTAGKRTVFGKSSVGLTAAFTTSGARVTSGQSASSFTAAFTTQGRLGARGALVTPFTASLTTQGRLGARGQAVTPLTASFLSEGRLGARSAAVLPLTLGIVTSGTSSAGASTWYGQTASSYTLAIASSGRRSAQGASSVSLTAAFTSAGERTAFGQLVIPLTATFTTAGRLGARGSSILPLTAGFTSSGFLTAKGQVVLPLTLGIISDGAVAGQIFGKVALPLSLDLLSQGVVGAKGRVALPLTLTLTSAGIRGTTGAVSLPLQVSVGTNGRRQVLGQVSLSELLEIVTVARGLHYGQVSLQPTFELVTQGTRETLGLVLAGYTLAISTSGVRDTFSAVELGLLLSILTQGIATGPRTGRPPRTGHTHLGLDDGRVLAAILSGRTLAPSDNGRVLAGMSDGRTLVTASTGRTEHE